MQNWDTLIKVANERRHEAEFEAAQARLLRQDTGSHWKAAWLIRFIALTLILVGLIALWAH